MAVQTLWTLEYPAGNEQPFSSWGFTDPKLRIVNQAVSTFAVRLLGAARLVAAPPIPFEGQGIIRANRAPGGAGFSGGEVIFVGRQITRRSRADSQSPADTLTFADAWYDLSKLVFQQQWNYGSPSASAYFCRLNLFQRYDLVTGIVAATNGLNIINVTLASAINLNTGDYITLIGVPGIGTPLQVTVASPTQFSVPGQLGSPYLGGGQAWPINQRITNGIQIQQIIAFAQACGVNIQPGVIDLNYPLPIYPVKAVTCESALQICIKPQPDAVAWIDYGDGSAPPRFNCRAKANLVQITMPYGTAQVGLGKHSTSDITPRYDLQPPAVVLQYQKTSQTNGQSYTDFATDAYPLNATGRTLRAMVVPIDLRGGSVQSLSVLVEADALPNLPSGDAPSLAWWQQKKNELKKYVGLTMVPGSLVVKDDAGNDLTATWQMQSPNEYKKGEILSWMGVTVTQVTIEAQFNYSEVDASNRTWLSTQTHKVSARIKLTNSPVGAVPYNAVQSIDPGETVPPGLAQMIWTSLQALQFEGSHTMLDPMLSTGPTIFGPRYLLNLVGGAPSWATMNATIQSTDVDFFNNRQTFEFGPAKHLSPGDWEELLQFWRWRTVYDNPNLRISGNQSQTQSAQVGGDTAAENTTHGNPLPSLFTVQAGPADSTTQIQHDAANGLIALGVVDVNGNQVPDQSNAVMKIHDLQDDGTVRNAKFLWLRFKDANNGCAAMKMKVFGTPAEPDV